LLCRGVRRNVRKDDDPMNTVAAPPPMKAVVRNRRKAGNLTVRSPRERLTKIVPPERLEEDRKKGYIVIEA